MKKLSSLFLDILLKILGIKPLVRFLKRYKPFIIVILIAFLLFCIEWFKTLDVREIVEYKKHLLYLVQDYPLISSFSFFLIYLFVSILSVPGLTAFSLIGGFLFGFVKGTLLSVFAMSIGSSIAFLLVRFFLYDFFIRKGGVKIKKIYKNLKKDEVYYLFALRLFPFTPIFFANIIMGLSSIKLSIFYIVSLMSFLPLIVIYVNMGSQLSQLEDMEGLMAPNLLFAFALMGLFPLLVRHLFRFLKRFRKSKADLPLESDSFSSDPV